MSRLHGRLQAAVWAWRLRVPLGRAGHRYMAALERQLAAHLARHHAAMLSDGWPPDQAQAAALEWLHDLVAQAARDALAAESSAEGSASLSRRSSSTEAGR